jgi:hypothetical protein
MTIFLFFNKSFSFITVKKKTAWRLVFRLLWIDVAKKRKTFMNRLMIDHKQINWKVGLQNKNVVYKQNIDEITKNIHYLREVYF